MEKRDSFDYTMMSTFMTCRRRYEYRINRGLVSKRPATALTFGGAIHEGLDSWYNDKDVDKAVKIFKEGFEQRIEEDDKRTHAMGEWILRNYHEQYKDQPWELVASERAFELPFRNGKKFIGRIDKIVRWGHESNPEIVKELEYILNKLSHMVDKPREEDSGEKR